MRFEVPFPQLSQQIISRGQSARNEMVGQRVGMLIVLLLLLVTRVAQAGDDPFAGADDYVRAAMKKWEVPGLAMVVIKDGKVVFSRGIGECELGSGRQVGPETRFAIASCSKSITAAALAILVDEGKLRWDDPIAKHLPDFEFSDPYLTKNATVRDLLSHRTGLRRADLLQDGTGFAPAEVLRRLKHLETVAAPRTRLIYNNHTFTLLGELAARVSGQPFDEFVDVRLFKPLDMSFAKVPPREILALRHWRSDDGIVSRAPAQTDGMYLTASDMSKWLTLHLAEGNHQGRQLIKPETVREMHALQFSEAVKFRPKDNVYAAQFYGTGLGWFAQDYRGRKIVLHSGAWGAIMGLIPEEQLGVVVLSNLDLESLAPMLMYDVFDTYLVGPEHAWDQQKWQKTWLKHEPPANAYRRRDQGRALLERTRKSDTHPSLPVSKYTGRFESPLYGSLHVVQHGDQLAVVFGEHETAMSHWQNESFYVRSPTRLTFDWLLTFDLHNRDDVVRVTVKHVGWDQDQEKDHAFERALHIPAKKETEARK